MVELFILILLKRQFLFKNIYFKQTFWPTDYCLWSDRYQTFTTASLFVLNSSFLKVMWCGRRVPWTGTSRVKIKIITWQLKDYEDAIVTDTKNHHVGVKRRGISVYSSIWIRLIGLLSHTPEKKKRKVGWESWVTITLNLMDFAKRKAHRPSDNYQRTKLTAVSRWPLNRDDVGLNVLGCRADASGTTPNRSRVRVTIRP